MFLNLITVTNISCTGHPDKYKLLTENKIRVSYSGNYGQYCFSIVWSSIFRRNLRGFRKNLLPPSLKC